MPVKASTSRLASGKQVVVVVPLMGFQCFWHWRLHSTRIDFIFPISLTWHLTPLFSISDECGLWPRKGWGKWQLGTVQPSCAIEYKFFLRVPFKIDLCFNWSKFLMTWIFTCIWNSKDHENMMLFLPSPTHLSSVVSLLCRQSKQ